MRLSILCGRSSNGQVFYAKSDVQAAFHLVPLKGSSWRWLILKVEHPILKKIFYFVDKCLPFGASISCSHFQRISDAIRHIVEWRAGIPDSLSNYLDDYLFIAITIRLCNLLVKCFMDTCAEIGIPVAAEKTVWATQLIVFFGILLDDKNLRLTIPEEKRIKAVNQIGKLICKRKATVLELQQVAGILNFLSRAIVPGRAFTRRIYAKCTGHSNLKQHHHVRLDGEFKSDCGVWMKFLNTNQITTVSRPFIDLDTMLRATTLQFYSDASLNAELGFRAQYEKEWTYGQWPPAFVKREKPSIEYVELFGLVVAAFIWADKLRNKRVLVYCDNQTVVTIVNNTTSSCKNCMVLIRLLVLKSLQCNFRLFAQYIRSKDNEVADSLSRLDFVRFNRLAHKLKLNNTPQPLPNELWPATKIWVK